MKIPVLLTKHAGSLKDLVNKIEMGFIFAVECDQFFKIVLPMLNQEEDCFGRWIPVREDDEFRSVWERVLLPILVHLEVAPLAFFGQIIGQELFEGVSVDDDRLLVSTAHCPLAGLPQRLHVLPPQLFNARHIEVIKIY